MLVPAATILARADAALGTSEPSWRSAAPGRERASALVDLGAAILPGDAPPELAAAWAEGVAGIAQAMRASFPGNLLWDLDHLAACLWADAAAQPGPAAIARLEQDAARIEQVQRIFGRDTPVAFRYVHDFTYGFDWAKWVARDPASRAAVGPYAPTCVAAMLERGRELHRSIDAGDDAKYPPLADGRARNPFAFSREPADELRLIRHLAAAGALPVEAWRTDEPPRWDRPYAALRERAATDLGM